MNTQRNAPGRSQVTLESLVGNERFELYLELAETSGSGLVVAKESGDPVADTWVRLQRDRCATTDASGYAELAAPAGRVDVEVRTGPSTVGRASVGVQPGETVPLEIVVEQPSRNTP